MKTAAIPADEPQRLALLRRQDILDTPQELEFDDFTELAATLCDAPMALISLVDAHRQWTKSWSGFALRESPRESSFCAHTILQADIFVVPDTHDDPRFRDHPWVVGAPHVRFYAACPLSLEGHHLGTLCVLDRHPRSLRPEQRTALFQLARRVVGRLEHRLIRRRFAEQSQQFETERDRFFRLSLDMLCIADTAGRFKRVNPAFTEVLGYNAETLTGRPFLEFVHPDDREATEAETAKLAAGVPTLRFENRYRHADGSWRWLSWRAQPDVAEGVLYATARDVTALRAATDALRLSEEKLSVTLGCIGDGVLATDVSGCVTLLNPVAETLTGWTQAEALGRPVEEVFRIVHAQTREPAEVPVQAVLQTGVIHGLANHTVLLARDGRERPIADSAAPIRDRAGAVIGVVLVFRDQTELEAAHDGLERTVAERTEALRQSQDRIRQSLHEKETLLKEIHHRVKNNLQIIGSLLAWQAETLPDPGLRAPFEESIRRLRSMSLIHERLYQSDALGSMDFSEYTESLSSFLFRSYAFTGRARIRVEADPCTLNIDTAIPCGLILNELVSNALKHAFPDGHTGEVVVSLRRVAAGRFCLGVHDDGVGLPEGFDPAQTTSLGMQLVTSLTRQIKGALAITRDRGTGFQIEFKELTYGTR